MKRFLDGPSSIDDLKRAVIDLQNREDKRAFYLFIAVVIGLLVATTAGVVYLVKKSMRDDFEDEWDDDWDDEFEYDDEIEDVCEDCDEDDCDACGCECCTDSDFDTSVKVEKL
ncbi:hypothetical protein B5E58_02810 [Tyzzerella sp. An114]|uniref:hypothetical protein n=1 Tax=Tyzzerella sp. An114 TaxID=1965545 RepID=UPI000B455351|nr:hypothetical protein [Tyzzerella sp. An114]OUQ60036.1 hypothetical protein B5E58_02810 [Tyzzerella sp. An114]